MTDGGRGRGRALRKRKYEDDLPSRPLGSDERKRSYGMVKSEKEWINLSWVGTRKEE
jgi:hypothetical protein